jgi:hypothetical protein
MALRRDKLAWWEKVCKQIFASAKKNAQRHHSRFAARIRLLRAGCPRARRGRARLAFCRSKSKPSAPEHCDREFCCCRISYGGCRTQVVVFKGSSANMLASLRKRQKGSGEKRRAFPRMGARRAPGVRGEARHSRTIKPCIKTAVNKYRPPVRGVYSLRMLAASTGGSGGVLRRPRTPHALF